MLLLLLRFLTLFVAFGAASAVSFALVGPSAGDAPEPAPGALVLFILLDTSVLALVASHLRGPWLPATLACFVALFGPMSFMSQIESIFFISKMATGDALRVMAAGGLLAAFVAPLAVRLFASGDGKVGDHDATLRLPRTLTAWLPRLAAVALLYLSLYFVFGYFVAWSQPAVRAFYGGEDPQGFGAHMVGLLRDDPGLLLFQVVRSFAWTGIAVVLLARFRGSTAWAALVVGLAFAVFMNAGLLLPNPFMPEEVRMAHLVETTTSNLLFGALLVVIVVLPQRAPSENAR